MLISQIYKAIPKRDVAVKQYNRMILKRKLRLASYVDAPRLIKSFHSRLSVS